MISKAFFLCLCACLLGAPAQAQQPEEVRYFTEFGRRLPNADSAAYYIKAKFNRYGNMVGPYAYFYMNGQKKTEGACIAGDAVNQLTHWYENGQVKSVQTKDSVWRMQDLWKQEVTQMVKGGNGLYAEDSTGNKKWEMGHYANGFKQGKWVGGHFDSIQYRFEEYYEADTFKGGMMHFNDTAIAYTQVYVPAASLGNIALHIQRKLVYPDEAIDNGIQGRVLFEFVIDKMGKMRDLIILESPDPILSKEAMRIITHPAMPGWKVGLVRGVPVNSRMRLPVVFKLSE
jgi:TonB family protein